MTEAPEGKVYDTDKKEWIDAPVEEIKKEETTEEKKEEPPAPEKKEEKTPTPEEAAAKVAAEAKKDEPVTNTKKDELPAWLKEKYGIESQEDLDDVLGNNKKLADELEKERGKKVFTSEKEEKLHKFLLGWDLDKIGEGMETAAVLTRIDIPNIDGKRALEEQFILDNTELTRDEAKQLFAREFRKKYDIKKADFDTDEEYEEEKKLTEIQQKKDVSKARKFLEEKQKELKAKPEEKKPEKKEDIPTESIKSYENQIKSFFKKDNKEWDRFQYKDETGTELYAIVLDADKRKQVQDAMSAYVQRPDVYDKNGKIDNFDAEELALKFTQLLFGKWMDQEHHKQIKILAQTVKAEQLAGKKPDKVSKSMGKASGQSYDEQFAEAARIAKEKRGK
jgi:hypothetical protein